MIGQEVRRVTGFGVAAVHPSCLAPCLEVKMVAGLAQ